MQDTSNITNYDSIVLREHWFETKVVIDGVGTFTEDQLFEVTTSHKLFKDTPEIGRAIAGEVEIKMLYPNVEIPIMAVVRLFVRACNSTTKSGWLPQGVFNVDTRERTKNDSGMFFLTIHGYDAMLKSEQMYNGRITGNSTDIQMATEIAYQLGVSLDSRTNATMTSAYTIPFPTGYTYREILGYIASMYAGAFIISDEGKLRLITLYELPPETNCLIDENGNWITFGGDRILV